MIGTGTGGVVLGPQDNGDICQMLPYAEELATRYRVALFDWDEPRTELPLLAAAAVRDAGAQKVVLGGASYGGFLAMSEAHKVRAWQAGVLSFGGEITLPGLDGRPGIRKWQGPLLDSCVACTRDRRRSSCCPARRTAWTCSTTPSRPGSARPSTATSRASSADLPVSGHRSLRRNDAAASPQTIATHTAAHAR